jgi:chorismate mutase
MDYLNHLLGYLQSVKESKPMVCNYAVIRESAVFKKLKNTLKQSKNTFLVPSYIESLFKHTFAKIRDDFEHLIDTLIKKLTERMQIIKALIEQNKPKKTMPF